MNSISISYLYSLFSFYEKINIFNYFSTTRNLASIYQISNILFLNINSFKINFWDDTFETIHVKSNSS